MSKSAIAVILLVILGQCFSALCAEQNPNAALPELTTQAFVGTQSFEPQNDEEWVAQCLNLNLDQKKLGCRIVAYRILWYGNGKWSSWFVPGVNDLYKKEGEPLRRYWACFNDHQFEIIYMADTRLQFPTVQEDVRNNPIPIAKSENSHSGLNSEPLKHRLDAIIQQLTSPNSRAFSTILDSKMTPMTMQQAASVPLPLSLPVKPAWCAEYKGFFIYSYRGTAEELFAGSCYAIKRDDGKVYKYNDASVCKDATREEKVDENVESISFSMMVERRGLVLALNGTIVSDKKWPYARYKAALKKQIKTNSTVMDAVKLLGPGYVDAESGTDMIVWFFDDGSTASTIGWPGALDDKVKLWEE